MGKNKIETIENFSVTYDHPVIGNILESYEMLEGCWTAVSLAWLPGHLEVPGNKKAN